MTIKRNLIHITLGFTLLILINILFFPITKSDLQNETTEKIEKVLSEEIIIGEHEEITEFILYLVKTVDEKHYFSLRNFTHDILVCVLCSLRFVKCTL